MKAKKILSSDITELKVSSLPTKPTAPRAMGGMGYGAKEMKEAFDRLPLFIIERFNALLDDILSTGDDSLASAIKSGLKDSHTLADLFCDLKSGELANYLSVDGESLNATVIGIKSELKELRMLLESLRKENDVCQE